MAYTKTTWVDEVLSDDERYDIKEDGGGAFKATMQIVLATGVAVAGTPVNATNLNHAEVGIENAQIAADAAQVTANAAALPVKQRQGGSATDWNLAGTTTYVPTSVVMQCGNKAPAANGTFTITFPVAFAYKPIVLVTGDSNYGFVTITAVSTTQATGVVYLLQGGTPFHLEAGTALNTINWIAIGPV
jgi:hypothetical protein